MSRNGGAKARRMALFLLPILLGAGALADYAPDTYFRDLTATNARQARNPLFPAGIRLEPGGETLRDAPDAAACGRCHPDAYHTWLSSAHRYADSDPFYRRVVEAYGQRAGERATLWCAGCHAPLRAVAEGSVAENSGEGVDCLSCHAMTGAEKSGNAHFALAGYRDYPFAQSKAGWERTLHDFLLRVRPGPHRRSLFKPELHRSSEQCGVCHRESLNVPQNHYQFVRSLDTYGEWLSGPASGRCIRPQGLTPGKPQTCQGCHFPREPDGHVSHAAIGANTALAVLNHDREHLQRTEALLQQAMGVDLFLLRRTNNGQPALAAWIAPLEHPREEAELRPGETVTLDVVVTNRSGGHNFPGGYSDIEDAWLEVTLTDGRGRVLLQNGVVSGTGTVPASDSQNYRLIPLDREGRAIAQHDLTAQVTTLPRRTIAPGSSDIARYRLTVPASGVPPFRLNAALRFRPVRPDFAEWAVPAKRLPADLPITTLASDSSVLPLPDSVSRRERAPEVDPGVLSARYVRYGEGLLSARGAPALLEAVRAFQAAQTLTPDHREPYLGAGRAYLHEPALLAARTQFEWARKLFPNDPAVQADLGVVYRLEGEYDRALELLLPLAARYPDDAGLQFDTGLVYTALERYGEAENAFRMALAADPDNAAAHFQLMRCYQRLHRVPEARREEVIGRYLAPDSLAPVLTPRYLHDHPEAQRELLPIPEHSLVPPETKR